ncbi:MAG: Bifunctional phosphoglucose/phosphomannose isomerase [Candidatus Magasanikbacteria bacterium GW2011_GWA2_37_8]|uniref:Bifunctional phosphoglucose/phosphomannose isomerase n=1 Tax=Candidatus Magasanikbacteria bacterium GW2011_GWA2_37_8 TaxID=1619036 RepID=A0A0G0JQ82_9BACT|nr:MAG: Bifunctional phosphoglucose/phosphomannose isomerase [Candidatus Magasanikbacteria bacterium GW2011_GWA2_37_8]
MSILNNLNEIKKLDSQNMLGSIELLGAQVKQIWEEGKKLKLPISYKKVKNVVVAGMGGSNLPARIIKSVFRQELKVPVEISNDYLLPEYVNKDTLVILSSYSGSTEEVLVMAKEAAKKKAKIVVVTSGKYLAKMVKAGIPGLVFATNNNPCSSPRMGLGYAILGQLIIFKNCGLIKFGDKDLQTILKTIEKYTNLYGIETKDNLAKRVSLLLKNKAVIFMAGEHLVGSAHVVANQMNENNKRLAVSFAIPELNHHLLEGMKLPASNPKNILTVIFNSDLYDKRIVKRVEVTRNILAQNNIANVEYLLAEATRLGQAFEALIFSSYLSFYGAMLEGLDPTAIPYVDFFKEQLKKK